MPSVFAIGIGCYFLPLEALAASQCADLPSHAALRSALQAAQHQANGGLGAEMWATIVNRDGVVCAIAFTGSRRDSQVPGGRISSAAKANTANSYSIDKIAMSSANLYSAVQGGGSLFGFADGNPIDSAVAYSGPAEKFGMPNDPLVGRRIGGTITFGGGLALYAGKTGLIGALGVSGDTSCADHNVAWRTRAELKLDYVPGGYGPSGTDNIVYDIENGVSRTGLGHPTCGPAAADIANSLPTVLPPAKAR